MVSCDTTGTITAQIECKVLLRVMTADEWSNACQEIYCSGRIYQASCLLTVLELHLLTSSRIATLLVKRDILLATVQDQFSDA